MIDHDSIEPVVVSKTGLSNYPEAWAAANFGPITPYQRGTKSSAHRVRKAMGGTSGGIYDELGRTGLRHWGGFVFEEWLTELQYGRKAAEVYREMADQDPIVGAILYSIEMLVRRVEWWMEPASDKPEDKINADFMWSVLNDTYHAFEDMIAEIISFLQYGWSYFEMVFKRRLGPSDNPQRKSKYNDGKIGLRKLGVRSQDSLWKWVFSDEGELLGLIQNPPPDYQIRFIPYEKALLFRTKTVKDNPEGRSVLRSAYRPWYFLKNLQNIEGIGIERDLAGLPMLLAPQGVDIWNTNDPAMAGVANAAQNVVASIRRDEQEGVVIPFGWDLKLLATGGRRSLDINQTIVRYEQRIAASVLADVILLGMDKVGSYALASEKVALLGYSIGAYLDQVANVINTKLTPALFALNGIKGFTDFPQLRHGAIETLDLETLGTFMTGLAAIANTPLVEGEDGLSLVAALQAKAGLPGRANEISGIGPDTAAAADQSPTASAATTPKREQQGARKRIPTGQHPNQPQPENQG